MSRRHMLVLSLTALVLAGCRKEPARVIAVIPKSTAHVFWVAVHAGAQAAAREENIEILWNGPSSETDYTRQIQIVDSMISRRVDGIAIAASERRALLQVLDRAAEAGIPVTVFDSGVEGANYVSYVATDNYQAGRMAARTLAESIGGRGDVAVIGHLPGSVSSMDRERGFQDALAEEFPGVRMVAFQFGQADRAKARAATENILSAHPNLHGLFSSTEASSTGVSLGLRGRGLAGKVKYVAFDSTDTMVEDLKNGTIHALIVQDPYRIGYEAVRTLIDRIKGGQPPKEIPLGARVVRASDLGQPDIQKLLFPERSGPLP